MSQATTALRQVVDWSAAVRAGLISGVVFLGVNMALSALVLGTPWVVMQILASLILGPDALPPPNTFEAGVFVAGLVVHLVLSVVFAAVLAIIIHRWGMLVGLFGGALFGLLLYGANFYAGAVLFPWFFLMRSWMMLVSHVVFGAVAGVVYEALEVERFVVDEP